MEVAPYDSSGNWIRAKTADMGSKCCGEVAKGCINGKTSGDYKCHTGSGSGWWRATYTDAPAVATLQIHNRGGCCKERINDYTVYLTTDAAGDDVVWQSRVTDVGLNKGTQQVYKYALGECSTAVAYPPPPLTSSCSPLVGAIGVAVPHVVSHPATLSHVHIARAPVPAHC